MKIFSSFFSDPFTPAFGWTLVHSIWQATTLFLIGALAFFLLRKQSAGVRYLSGVSLLFSQVAASVATFIFYYLKLSSVIPASKLATTLPTVSNVKQFVIMQAELPLRLKMQIWLTTHLNELVICWLIGAAILLLRFFGSWLFTERLRSQAKLVTNREWRARLGLLVAKMNISKSVDFKETPRILTPMVIGAFSPVILVPLGFFTGFSTAQIEAILAHELAHIKRNDYLVNMLQSFVEVIFFFHPAIWWLSARIRVEREHCCDDIALSFCEDKVSLAHALVKVAEWQSAPAMAMAFASKKPMLLNRVQRILGITPRPARTFMTLPMMLLALGLAIGVSAYTVAQKAEKSKARKTAKTVSTKTQKLTVAKIYDTDEIPEPAELEIAEQFDEPAELQLTDLALDFDMDLSLPFFQNDSLNKKMEEINLRINGMHEELRTLHSKLDELNLEREKYQFEVERFGREIEKFELKKQRAAELRGDLMEKRSVIMQQDDKQSKLSDADLDKQLADFEQQIKAQEQIIGDLNTQIANARKEAITAEEPDRNLQREVEDIHRKISTVGQNIGKESRSYQKLQELDEPKMARSSKVARANRVQRATPPPPPPASAAPAKGARPAKAPAAPRPPAQP